MKVLFAVNDENISTSIVKKYQKQYKEIISYKNVYYFNAILKELQRNKNYDRVVISEDLEEFTSSSLEQKDKFIFDRLDNISDEAVASDGSDIPIILICSERRTKSEDILVRLFGISIYNAIIGKDRSTEEVCKLINKPRSKKEAKIYYKIDSENVNYSKENDSDVNEDEMRNILRHFKSLGNNEEEYAESFKRILEQYSEEQMKVIIKILPSNVKDILTRVSPEYCKISGSVPKNEKRAGSGKKGERIKKGPTERLLDQDANSIISKPVVVPTSMKDNMHMNINQRKKIDLEDIEDDEEYDDNDDIIEIDDIIEEKPKRRGRPPKNKEKGKEEEKPKRRGRPPKKSKEEVKEEVETLPGFDEEDESETVLPGVEDYQETYGTTKSEDVKKDEISNNIVNKDVEVLPGFDEEDEEDDYEDYNYSSKINEENSYNRRTVNNSDIDNFTRTNKNYGNTNEMNIYDNKFDDEEFEGLLAGDKKITAFVGTSKNGTSFVVNNVAQILADRGIDTAILDVTQNKSSYYIYTKNDEDLRKIAVDSLDNLIAGNANGIKVKNNLTVYTNIPNQNDKMKNSHPIMETLVKKHSLILIDCDFDTPIEYFDKAQELYLVQSMDILSIQPLTEFLKELKTKNVLDETKIRIVLNKLLRVRGITGKNIIGGMSNYNDPEMSFMTELFDRNTVKLAVQIPFDEDVYAKYLEGLVECEIKLNGYPKEIKAKLASLADVIYPLLPNNGNENKKGKRGSRQGYQYSNSFSSDMNNTLNNMRNKY